MEIVTALAIALAATLVYACVALARRVWALEDELSKERHRYDQLRSLQKSTSATLARTMEINQNLAYQRPMYFAGQPTLDATAYRAERSPSPVVWWTYDN